jgi:hypothetical protein
LTSSLEDVAGAWSRRRGLLEAVLPKPASTRKAPESTDSERHRHGGFTALGY